MESNHSKAAMKSVYIGFTKNRKSKPRIARIITNFLNNSREFAKFAAKDFELRKSDWLVIVTAQSFMFG